MRIVHDTQKEIEPKEKRIPLYKDEVFMAKLMTEFIADHNAKIRKQKSQMLTASGSN